MEQTFVLVHGSWHGGWAWKEVIKHLTGKGHRAFAPTLAGCGPGAERRGITHAHLATSLMTYVEQRDLQDIVLVGHSFGGTVVSRVSASLGSRVKRLVFLDAFILLDGQSVNDNLPEDDVEAFTRMAGESADYTIMLPWEIWREKFMQDATDSVARATYQRLTPQPYQPYRDKLELASFYRAEIPKSYINFRQDLVFPSGYWHPRMSSRLQNFKLVEMDGSHESLLTRAGELADRIVEAATE